MAQDPGGLTPGKVAIDIEKTVISGRVSPVLGVILVSLVWAIIAWFGFLIVQLVALHNADASAPLVGSALFLGGLLVDPQAAAKMLGRAV